MMTAQPVAFPAAGRYGVSDGWWMLNEPGGFVVRDATGRGQGVATSNITREPGYDRGICAKNGAGSDYVDMGAAPAAVSPIGHSGDLTVCGWMLISGGTYPCLISRSNLVGQWSFTLYLFRGASGVLGSEGGVGFYSDALSPVTSYIAVPGGLAENVWIFVGATHSYGRGLTVNYYNGRGYGSTNQTGGITITQAHDLRLAWDPDNDGKHTNHYKNIRLYSRALTPDEMWRLYVEPFAGAAASGYWGGRSAVASGGSLVPPMLRPRFFFKRKVA